MGFWSQLTDSRLQILQRERVQGTTLPSSPAQYSEPVELSAEHDTLSAGLLQSHRAPQLFHPHFQAELPPSKNFMPRRLWLALLYITIHIQTNCDQPRP